MTLIDTVKKMVFLAPCRCGRTFYKCDIVEYKNQINLKFTPTDEYLSVDPRREDEAFMPDHFHTYEKWQHVGLAIGCIEYFLKEHNIDYVVNESEIEKFIELTIKSSNIDVMVNLEKHQTFKHAHRSFDTEAEIDTETYKILSDKIDYFLKENHGHKMMVTDWPTRKKLHALAIYWDTMGEKNGYVKAPQMDASLLITVPPKDFNLIYILRMGRLYSDIGLTSISRGYQFAFCNAFNYLDPRIQRVENELGLKWGEYTLNNVIPRSFMCIGKALDTTKPFNWISAKNSYTDSILPSCILVTKEFVSVERKEEVV
jgi:hypothetical protein